MTYRLQTLADVEVALRPYVPLVAQMTGTDTTLDRIEPLMKLLGNPERQLKIIHVAGTSGKTSTAYYVAALLGAANLTVGLTVSPHVDTISERVQLNGQPLAEVDFCSELAIFLELIDPIERPPSYFELLYAFAIWVFARRQVDYAVIETGMGGLHDATNVASRADKVCLITDIGYDHMHILGRTLPEIAQQKIGIVHRGNVAITFVQSAEIMSVFERWTQLHAAPLIVLHEATERSRYGQSFGRLPAFQQRNWLLAYHGYNFIAQRDGLPTLALAVLKNTQQLQVPARMEIINQGDRTLVMDGAHNAQKMTVFVASFMQRFPKSKPAVLLALKTGKEYQVVCPLLAELASSVIVTTFKSSQDLPAKSMDPEVLATALRQAGATTVTVVIDQQQAYQQLMRTTAKVRVITGSFYLLSQLRRGQIL